MITHRNAWVNVVGTLVHHPMTCADRYLWTLPMFHANGRTFVWIVTAAGGTHVCARKVDTPTVYRLLGAERVTLLCAAPTVLITIASAPDELGAAAPRGVRALTAGAAPAAHTIERVEEELGWTITQVYGLTETAPFISVCEPRPAHAALSVTERARLKARQGVELITSGELRVVNQRGEGGPRDGATTTGSVDLAYYEGNEKRARGAVSGRLGSDRVLGSLNVMYGEFDGNIRNIFLGTDVNGYERKGARGKLQIAASDNVDIALIADYAQDDDTGSRGAFVTGTSAQAAAIAPITFRPDNADVKTNLLERVEDRNYGASLQIDWGIGEHTLTSITAYRKWKNTQYQDGDAVEPALRADRAVTRQGHPCHRERWNWLDRLRHPLWLC